MKWKAYWQLMRMDKPVGIYLLWFPTAWALWAARMQRPSWSLLILFALGTVAMRAAGCVINDIADRHIDKHVARTQARPLTSGLIRLEESFALLIGLLFIALGVLLCLPRACFKDALFAVLVAGVYPFLKRYIQAPQLVLGLAFSMGMPMAYAALNVPWNSSLTLLLLANFCWIVAYDTMYAMTDRADDLKIGMQSTAILLGDYDRLGITLLLAVTQALLFVFGFLTQMQMGFWWLWSSAFGVLAYQLFLIRDCEPLSCFKAFKFSVYYGLLIWAAILVGVHPLPL